MGNELSHSNTDPSYLAQMAGVYQDACAKGMACNLRDGGAPSMYKAPAADANGPALTNRGPGLELG